MRRWHLVQVCNVGTIVGGTGACAWTVSQSLPDWRHTILFMSRITPETQRESRSIDLRQITRVTESLLTELSPIWFSTIIREGHELMMIACTVHLFTIIIPVATFGNRSPQWLVRVGWQNCILRKFDLRYYIKQFQDHCGVTTPSKKQVRTRIESGTYLHSYRSQMAPRVDSLLSTIGRSASDRPLGICRLPPPRFKPICNKRYMTRLDSIPRIGLPGVTFGTGISRCIIIRVSRNHSEGLLRRRCERDAFPWWIIAVAFGSN